MTEPSTRLLIDHARPASTHAAWMDLIPDGVLIVDRQARIVEANLGMGVLSGRSPDELRGQELAELLPPDQRFAHRQHLQAYFEQPHVRPMGRVPDLALWRSDGRRLPVDIALRQFRSGADDYVLVVLRDVTEMRALHEKTQYLAMHDALTGLYSRYMFSELLSQALTQSTRAGQSLALLLIDLDDFKSINDGHGHQVGDAFLKETALRMKTALRSSDVLARLGGDEFAVLLRNQAEPEQTLRVSEKLSQAIGQPWRTGHHELYSGASIGIAFAPRDGADAHTLLRHADLAMYSAKADGRGCHAVFHPRMAARLEEKMLLQGRLKRALLSNELRLHYQPQLCARDGHIVGVEALLRWHDPQLGEVAPSDFIPVAESTGLILALGDWVLNEACRQIAAWRDQGLMLRVAVNVSAQQLRQPLFALSLQEILQTWQLCGDVLELEITESAAMTSREQAGNVLRQVAALGVHLALDDFGMGYSSLGHLRQLPVSRLKIDRSFIQGLGQNEEDRVLTRAVIGLAKIMGKAVVAEGVESDAQREFLAREGCDELQGWLFSPAVAPDRVPGLLQRFGQAAGAG